LKYIEEFKDLSQQSPILNFFRNPLKGLIGYDEIEHHRLHEIELWKKRKVYSWHHRQYSGDQFSGYYYFNRRLLFKKSKIVLRDYIVEQLCEIVSKLSLMFGEKTELKIEGLIPLSKIDDTLEQWKTGKLKIDSISDIL
jgi:hypothetical protein